MYCTSHCKYHNILKCTVIQRKLCCNCNFFNIGKPKRGALSELTGTMSRAAGLKITRIISFSKRKPTLPGETRSSLFDEDPRCGKSRLCLLHNYYPITHRLSFFILLVWTWIIRVHRVQVVYSVHYFYIITTCGHIQLLTFLLNKYNLFLTISHHMTTIYPDIYGWCKTTAQCWIHSYQHKIHCSTSNMLALLLC